MNENLRHELSDLIKEKEPSIIPLEKPVPLIKVAVTPSDSSKIYWSNISQELLDRYLHGENLGKFGNNKKTNEMVFKRLAESIIEIIKNECFKENKSGEDLQLHFDALFSIMLLLGKALSSKQLTKSNPDTIMASLHGYIESYVQQIIKG